MFGSVLSDVDIRKAIESGELKIYTDAEGEAPFRMEQIQVGSIDLHLRKTVRYFNKSKDVLNLAYLNNGRNGKNGQDGDYTKLEVIESDYFILDPGDMVLGTTRESIELPLDMAGFIYPRLTVSKMGIGMNCVYICPGHGHPVKDEVTHKVQRGQSIPVEIVNNSPIPVQVPIGKALCQLILVRTMSPASQAYTQNKNSQYRFEGDPLEAEFGN